MTLGTADETGRSWVSPVYYACEGYARFYWVSSPEATHSRNLRTPVGFGQGVYVSALAQELAGDDLDGSIAIISRRSDTHGAGLDKPAPLALPRDVEAVFVPPQ